MTMRRAITLGCAALLLLGAAGAAADDRNRGAGKPKGFRLVLTGVWTQPGCVPTQVSPDVQGQAATIECTGVATYTGQLNGYAKQHIRARGSATVTTARIVADIYGRTSNNLCGSLHLDPEHGVVAGTGMTGEGPITAGTGDFAGVTGWYDTTGFGVGGVGEGGYRIVLDFPRKAPPTPAAAPCIPPAPAAHD